MFGAGGGGQIRLIFKANFNAILQQNAYSVFVQSIIEEEEFDIPEYISGWLIAAVLSACTQFQKVKCTLNDKQNDGEFYNVV